MTFVYMPNPNRLESPVDQAKCAAAVWDGLHHYQCRRKGILEHDGRLWCKQHHPPTSDERKEARHAKVYAKWDAQKREMDQKARDAADISKFRALAKRAAEFTARSVQRWEDRDALLAELVEIHKEATDG